MAKFSENIKSRVVSRDYQNVKFLKLNRLVADLEYLIVWLVKDVNVGQKNQKLLVI